MSVRQFKRLVRRYKDGGPAWYRSAGAGGRTTRWIRRCEVMAWVRKRYADFGPTLACEKLTEAHGSAVG